MRGRRPRLAVVLGLAAHWLVAEPGHAQQSGAGSGATDERAPTAAAVAKAEMYASAAYQAYLRKEHDQAVALYEEALAVAPNTPLVLYNIARIYDVGLNHRGLAIEYYQRFMAAPGAEPQQILRARERIAELESAAPGATTPVALDAPLQRDASEPVAPSEPPLVPPAPITRPPSPAEQSAWTSREITALAVGGAGVASLAVGTGFLVSANAKSDLWKRDCEGDSCSTQRGVEAAESASRQVAIGTAGLVAGGVLLGLGGVFWLVGISGATNHDGDSSWSVSPVVGDSELSAALSGRF